MSNYIVDDEIAVMSVISDDFLWDGAPLDTFTLEDFKRFLTWAVLEVKANDIFIETNEPYTEVDPIDWTHNLVS